MKFSTSFSVSRHGGKCRLARGFTLSEIVVAMSVFILVVAGVLSAHLFGLRMFKANESKLITTEWSRRTFGKITDEIRACNSVSILNVDTNGNFTGLLDGETQQGNALQIYQTTNTDSYILYFLNLADQSFRQTMAQPSGTNTIVLAELITNTIVFSAEDLAGNVQTNLLNNRMIHLTLEFYQPQRFMEVEHHYKLETSVTRRSLD